MDKIWGLFKGKERQSDDDPYSENSLVNTWVKGLTEKQIVDEVVMSKELRLIPFENPKLISKKMIGKIRQYILQELKDQDKCSQRSNQLAIDPFTDQGRYRSRGEVLQNILDALEYASGYRQ
jgi:hypothetical protein